MGWRPTGSGDDIVGDDVADELVGGLEFHGVLTKRKPSLQELIDATATAIRERPAERVADPETLARGEILAVLGGAAPPLVSGPAPIDVLYFVMNSKLQTIAELYLATEHRRLPRVSEVLESVAIVVRAGPEKLLRDADGLELVRLEVLPPRA